MADRATKLSGKHVWVVYDRWRKRCERCRLVEWRPLRKDLPPCKAVPRG